MELEKTWTEIKALISARVLNLQYVEESNPTRYLVYAEEQSIVYKCLLTDSSEITDFETNYKSDSNKPIIPRSIDSRPIVRVDSRPIDWTIAWTGRSDSANGVFDGKETAWDFSNNDDLVTAPSGYKRKRIEFFYIDEVRIKDGTLFYFNKLKGSYFDIFMICPDGEYYYDNDGVLQQATEDTKVYNYLSHIKLFDSTVDGFKFDSEGCTDPIPTTYKFWMEITVPDTDSSSHGHMTIEMFRKRTMIL
jgi:hypothetical protein